MIVGHMPRHPDELVAFARAVHATGAARLWQGESVDLSTAAGFAYLAGLGHRVPVGTAVSVAALRHPLEAAVQARSLATVTGHDTVLGIGPGSDELLRGLRGAPYRSPLSALREYLTILRGLLDGSAVEHAGEYHHMHGGFASRAHPPVALGLGVLRPGMARLAGELADVALTWMTPPHYVRDELVPALREGARRAGRDIPRVAAVVHVALSGPGRDPYLLAHRAAHVHLGLPHYADMLRRAGLAVHHSAPVLGARALVDSGTFISGSPDEVRAALTVHAAAGVDEVVLNVAGVHAVCGPAAAQDDLWRILDGWGG